MYFQSSGSAAVCQTSVISRAFEMLRRRWLIPFALVLAVRPTAALATPPPGAAAPGTTPDALVVSAAASLADALGEIAGRFERERGVRVIVNAGGSNSLARQIVAGAPVDLFISADSDQMLVVERAGRVEAGSEVTLLSNRLVVLTARGPGPRLHAIGDLLDPAVRRIATGDPAAVPVGVYARRYLSSLGLWSRLESKIVPGVSVRAALAAVESGEVDAAIVYRSDATIARRAVLAFEIPETEGFRIAYPAAVISNSRHAALARDFLRELRSPSSLSVFERFGFVGPGSVNVSALPVPAGNASGVDTASLWSVAAFTVSVALGATLLMLPPAIVLAWVLARGRFHGKAVLETLVSLPLVLPPVATGLVLLYLLGRRGPFGALLASGGVDIVFTWKAVVIAMAAIGFPLVVRTARVGFEQVTRRYEQVAETLGAGPFRVFFTISLPLASRDVLAGALLGFSRALGEFGATIVVAGSLPGRTRTIAVAMFNDIETGRDPQAAMLLLVSAVIAFAAVWVSNVLVKGRA